MIDWLLSGEAMTPIRSCRRGRLAGRLGEHQEDDFCRPTLSFHGIFLDESRINATEKVAGFESEDRVSDTEGSNSPSASELGFVAQKAVIGAYIKAAATMKSVTVTDSKGRLLSKPDDIRKGPDGGVDATAIIDAKRPQDVSRVATMLENKVRKIVSSNGGNSNG